MTKGLKITFIVMVVVFTIGFALLGGLVFKPSYLRLGESFVDLWNSIKYYFLSIIKDDYDGAVTVTNYSEYLTIDGYLPDNLDGIKAQASDYFARFIDSENFRMYMSEVGYKLYRGSKVLMLIIPFIVLIVVLFKMTFNSSNTAHNKNTIFLRLHLKLSRFVYTPIKHFIQCFVDFLKTHAFILKLWVLIWVLNLNIASIIIAALSFYFYFCISFDFVSIFAQIAKLVIDLQVFFKSFPIPCYLIIAYCIFHWWRVKHALNTLNHMEAMDCGFINELPVVSMVCGSMGKGKTTMVVDMALSQEKMYRQMLLDCLITCDFKFPNFPWLVFEDSLKILFESGFIHNKNTAAEFVNNLKFEFTTCDEDPQDVLYGYDYIKYGLVDHDNLSVYDLFDILTIYAQAYYYYIIKSSYIISNLSIRSDNVFSDAGNFPLWGFDFFPKDITMGRFSHILDYDTMRLGKKLIEDNPLVGSLEFGVIVMSEVGKERLNQLDIKSLKKDSAVANQKNDLFNFWLKMCRHAGNLDFNSYIKVFTDEQRPESWGADARDLTNILTIKKKGASSLALPLFYIEDMICDFMFARFRNLYLSYRHRRGDNSLVVYTLKNFVSWLWRRNLRIHNRFGYCVLSVDKEVGTQDGEIENKKYYLMSKKIYSNRFMTDCFSDYFADLSKHSNVSIDDYLCYRDVRASLDELKLQNSYFINDLISIKGDENE